MSLLKIIGAATVLAAGVWGFAQSILKKIGISFKKVQIQDWKVNALKGLIVADVTFAIGNYSSLSIDLKGFEGFLLYGEQRMATVNQAFSKSLSPGKEANITFRIKSDITLAVSRLIVVIKQRKQQDNSEGNPYEGAKIVGTLKIAINGIPLSVPYSEPVAFYL